MNIVKGEKVNLFWPSAACVAIVSVFVFHTELSDLLGRIKSVGPSGLTMVERVDQININMSSPPTAARLQELKGQVASQAKEVLGMHPVSLAYFIRSATCSLWNTREIRNMGHIKYIKELSDINFVSVYNVKNDETIKQFGGEGSQIIFSDQGKFLLMAFEVDAQDCKPAAGAEPYVFSN